MSNIPMKTLTIDGQTYKLVDPNAVRFNESQDLTPEEQAQARANMGINLFSYNFTVVDTVDSNGMPIFRRCPEDANAIDHIVQNWQQKPMNIYVQGYPVIGLDINNHHLKVLYNDRYIYTFNWAVSADLLDICLYAHAVSELVYKAEATASVDRLAGSIKKYIDEQDAAIGKEIGDIDTALDGILAIQNSLIGGGSA